MAQESKAGSAVNLSLEELCLGVHAFGASVVVIEGDRGGGGVDVLMVAADGERLKCAAKLRNGMVDGPEARDMK